jgi:hypothetical protein
MNGLSRPKKAESMALDVGPVRVRQEKTRVPLPKSVKICNDVIRALFSVDKPNSRSARPLANPYLLHWSQANFRF